MKNPDITITKSDQHDEQDNPLVWVNIESDKAKDIVNKDEAMQESFKTAGITLSKVTPGFLILPTEASKILAWAVSHNLKTSSEISIIIPEKNKI